jgi:simple sugar transport system substrate-binding protein/basic membrane protein A
MKGSELHRRTNGPVHRAPLSFRLAIAAAVVAAMAVAGCGTTSNGGGGGKASTASAGDVTCKAPPGVKAAGAGTSAIGFIYVGSTTDYGYNEAAHDGAAALAKACPHVKLLEADTVPETSDMTRAAEQMIGQGAKVIFSTSYGYKDFAVKLADKHPDVAVFQQGNLIKPPLPANANTYFGNVYETVYLAGIAAGKATKSGKLGFVAAFPIPQTLLNINAFELGAQSVNPGVKTYTVFTGNWCDPGKQADAARSLLAENVDVLTQHQDCTGTIIKAAEAAGKYSVGYHYDASALAPKGWLTGSAWDWAPLYGAMFSDVEKGTFTDSPFHANYTVGFAGKEVPSPMNLAPYGPSVSAATKALISTAKAKILGGRSPFTGPVVDQAGKTRVAEGKAATSDELSSMDYLVKGVVGTIPK